jgi:UDP-3-O-[3-hydroxymyristoyl] glucosamine N-acyltransferase
MEIVNFITTRTKDQLENNNRKIYTLVVVNKADDMRLENENEDGEVNDTDKLELTGELSEMYAQVEKTLISEFERKNEYLNTYVEFGATLGANCTIICGVRIGKNAFVAAGAVVTKNVKPFALVAGVPAKQIGWMSRYGKRIPLPILGNGNYLCDITGDKYVLEHDNLTIL